MLFCSYKIVSVFHPIFRVPPWDTPSGGTPSMIFLLIERTWSRAVLISHGIWTCTSVLDTICLCSADYGNCWGICSKHFLGFNWNSWAFRDESTSQKQWKSLIWKASIPALLHMSVVVLQVYLLFGSVTAKRVFHWIHAKSVCWYVLWGCETVSVVVEEAKSYWGKCGVFGFLVRLVLSFRSWLLLFICQFDKCVNESYRPLCDFSYLSI